MAYNKFTPTQITVGATGAWTDVDLDTYITVPANASTVYLRIVTIDNGINYAFGVRKNGSTDNRTTAIRRGGREGAVIGIDAGNIFEAYTGNETDINIYIVGVSTDDAVMLTNGTLKTIASGSWVDIDISADSGADTATGAFLEWIATAAYGARKNGSTDNRVQIADSHVFTCCGVDGSEIMEAFRTSGDNSPYLIGYIKSDATFNTNAPDISTATTGSYVDLTALTTGAVAGIIEISGAGNYALRQNGATDDHYAAPGGGGGTHAFDFIGADGSYLIEGKISATTVDFFEIGIFTGAAGGKTPYLPWQSLAPIVAQ